MSRVSCCCCYYRRYCFCFCYCCCCLWYCCYVLLHYRTIVDFCFSMKTERKYQTAKIFVRVGLCNLNHPLIYSLVCFLVSHCAFRFHPASQIGLLQVLRYRQTPQTTSLRIPTSVLYTVGYDSIVYQVFVYRRRRRFDARRG